MDEDDEYEVPLRDQRYFGAGIKRKRINFVPSSAAVSNSNTPKSSSGSAADKYLAIVFNGGRTDTSVATTSSLSGLGDGEATKSTNNTCPLCHRMVTSEDNKTIHESSIAHQICLEHSHPPSNIDRNRKGLAVLQTHGWDPDARKGLGAQGEGVLHPVKAKENPSRVGLGADPVKVQEKSKPVRLDAGKVKSLESQNAKKAQDLRNAFYRSEDVERYLGQNQQNTTLDLEAFKRAKKK